MQHIFENANYNFVRWRWHAIALSWLVVLAGVAVAVARGGVPLGIDFTGGTVVIVKFEQPVAEDVVRRALDPVTTDKVVQQYGDPALHELLIRMPLAAQQEGNGLDQNARATVDALTKANVGKFEVINTEIVGPVVGKDLQLKGIYATLASLAGILIYIGLRFQFNFGARRDRRHLPRHHRHDGVPGVLQLRPVAECDRGDSHHHRLLGERHHRHLRPHPRELALEAPRVAGEGGQRQHQPDAVANHHHRRDDPA